MTNYIDQKPENPDVEMLDDVEIPLKNIEYTIQQYLLMNGARLDTETRILLACIRDGVGRVAGSSRALAERCPPRLI